MANKIVPQTLNSSGAYDKLITAISSGGTGAESESAAVKNLISGLTSTSPASDDLIPFQDVSSGGAGKTTLSALASTLQSVRGFAKIQTGSYVGTGTYGPDSPNTLTFGFVPEYVLITAIQASYDNPYAEFWNILTFGSSSTPSGDSVCNAEYVPSFTTEYKEKRGFINGGNYRETKHAKKSADGKTIYWYVVPYGEESSGDIQFNGTHNKYYWLALS